MELLTMANQISVNTGSGAGAQQVIVDSNGNITVTVSRSVIGTVANVASANYANFAGNVVNAAQPNITSVGTLTNLNVANTVTTNNLVVTGNFQVGNLVANTANYANFAGNAFAVAGANVSGTVANATFATTAGSANTANSATVANSANSVTLANVSGAGNIASINLDGNVSNILTGNGTFVAIPTVSANANYANFAGNAFAVDGANVNGAVANATFATTAGSANTANTATVANSANAVAGANVSGTVANATFATTAGSANTANSATVAASANSVTLANVSGAGNIASINLDGSTSNVLYGNGIFAPAAGGNTANANYANFAGTVLTNAQPNITSVGNLTSLAVTGNVSANAYQLTTSPGTLTAATGQMVWSATEQTMNLGMNYGVTQQVGLETYILIKASATISDGQVIMFTGANGDNVLGAPADTTSVGFRPEYIIGVATQNIANNAFGYVTVFGVVHGLNTNAYNVGDILWVDNATPGGLTATRPSDPNYQIEVAAVTKKSGGDGHIQVRVTAFNNIDSLTNVTTTTPSNGQALVYNGNIWVNGNPEQANIANVAYSVAAANVSGLGNIATINLDGNVSNLLTGNGTFVAIPTSTANANYANFAGTVLTNAQPNITSVGTLTALTVNSNTTIDVRSTNSNISFVANNNSNISGTRISFVYNNPVSNVNSVFGAQESGFDLYMANIAPGNVGTGNVRSYWQFLTNGDFRHTVGGTGNIIAKNLLLGNVFTGQFNGNIIAGNGNLGIGNITLAAAGIYTGNATGLTNIPGANVTGTVANATYAANAGNANIANTAYSVAAANVSGLGNIATINLDGNASNLLDGTGNFVAIPSSTANANYANFAGTVLTNAQPNITSVGNLTSLRVNGNIIANSLVQLTALGNSNTYIVGTASGTDLNSIVVGSNPNPNILLGGNVFITGFGGGRISLGGNSGLVTTGNVNINAGGTIGATGNITGGNLITAGLVSATGNVTGGNLITAGLVSATGNVTGGNLTTAGQVNAGNVNINTNSSSPALTINQQGNGGITSYNMYSNTSVFTVQSFFRSRGNASSQTAVGTNDTIFTQNYGVYGDSGNTFVSAGYQENKVGTNYGNGQVSLTSTFAASYTGSQFNVSGYDNIGLNGNVNTGNLNINSGNVQVNGRSLTLNGIGQQPPGNGVYSSLSVVNGGLSVNQDNIGGGLATFAFSMYENTTSFLNPYTFYRARGNASSPSAVANGDTVSSQQYYCYADSGNTYSPLGSFNVNIKNNGGAGNVSSSILINTQNTNDGSEISLATDIIKLNGNVTVGANNAAITSAGAISGVSSNVANTQLNRFQETTYNIGTTSGTITPDFNNGSIQNITLNGSITMNSLGNAVAGRSMTLILTQDGTGGRTLTSSMYFAGGSNTLSTAGGAIDIISMFYDGTRYYASLTKGYA
jgi:hypothetical protein